MKSRDIVSSLFNWISQIHETVHIIECHITLACEVAVQTTCFPECHHTGHTGHFLSHDEKMS